MEHCIAVIGIIVKDYNSVEELNKILHNSRRSIIGRMGIPCHTKNLSVMSIAVASDSGSINRLSEEIGALPGVTSSTAISFCEN